MRTAAVVATLAMAHLDIVCTDVTIHQPNYVRISIDFALLLSTFSLVPVIRYSPKSSSRTLHISRSRCCAAVARRMYQSRDVYKSFLRPLCDQCPRFDGHGSEKEFTLSRSLIYLPTRIAYK